MRLQERFIVQVRKLVVPLSVWIIIFMNCMSVLQNLETALAGEMGQMSLVNDYQTYRPNLGSS